MNKSTQLEVKRLTSSAKLPTRATVGSAGLDLYADKKITITSHHTGLVDTGLSIAIPEGYVGIIKIRSGFGTTNHVTENAGVIDSDYRGHVRVAVANISSDPLRIEKGEAIAQLLILPCWIGTTKEVENLDVTARGEKGFGSTGA